MTGRPIHLLLVEDNPDDIALLERALRGCPRLRLAAIARDPETALEVLRTDRAPLHEAGLDLVLLDVNLPRHNGFELLAQLRQDPRMQRVPVVMFTTSRRMADVERAYAAGACSYVTKPDTYRELEQLLRDFEHYWTQVARLHCADERGPA